MHKSSLSLDDYGMFPLESDVLGNGPASFGKGVTEKGLEKDLAGTLLHVRREARCGIPAASRRK
jgi:hypothetical protein